MDTVNLIPTNYKFTEKNVKQTQMSFASNNRTTYKSVGAVAAGSKINFNIALSPNNLLMSDPTIQANFTVGIVFNPAVAQLQDKINLMNGDLGFNSLPLNKCVSAMTTRMNGTATIAASPADDAVSLNYVLPYTQLQKISQYALPDRCSVYSNINLGDPLRRSMDSYGWGPRGIDSAYSVTYTNVDTSNMTINFTLSEKLISRPFQALAASPVPFVGVSDLALEFQMCNNFIQAVLAEGSPLFNISSCVCNSFNIVLESTSPHINFLPRLPTESYYNIPQLRSTVSAATTIANGASATLSVPVSSYSSVPKMFVLYAFKERGTDGRSPTQFYPLENVSVLFGLKNNQLKNVNVNDLYQISAKNGYNGTPSQFYQSSSFVDASGNAQQMMASVLCFRPSDIDTELFQSSNATANLSIGVDAVVSNRSGASAAITLKLVAVNNSILSYRDGLYSEEYTSISANELEAARNEYVDIQPYNMVGGFAWADIWTKVKQFAEDAKPYVRAIRQNIPVVAKQLKAVPVIGDEIEAVGEAVDKFNKSQMGQKLTQMGYGKKKVKGGAVDETNVMLGGQQLSNKKLLELLMK